MLRTYKYRIYPRQHSSGTCGGCGYVLDELDLSVRLWTCPVCSLTHDRDINAAKNIRQMGAGAGSSEGPV